MIAQYKKFAVALLGMVAQLPADEVPAQWRPWVHVVVGLATALGVCKARNDDYPVES